MRKLVILTQMPSSFPNEGVLICAENVHKVKQYLGTEHPFAIYDMRTENGIALNLEALAIIAGTIQAHGTLFLVCPQWATLEQEIDADSLRWNDDVAVPCPHFYRYFKQLILRYGFEITEQLSLPTLLERASRPLSSLLSKNVHGGLVWLRLYFSPLY